MSKNSRWAEYSDFSGGEMSDISASLIPDNGLLYAENVFTDKSGRLSIRGAIRNFLQSANSNYYNSLGTSDDSENASLQRGYASRISSNKVILDSFEIGAGTVGALATGSVSTTSDVGSYSAGVPGDSFNSFGICGFPIAENTTSLGSTYNALPFVWAGGAAANVGNFSTTSGSATFKAGDSKIQFTAGAYAAFTATTMAGQFFYATVGAGTDQNEYVGKIVSQDNAAYTITVTPTPKNAFVATYYSRSTTFGMGGANFEAGGGARPIGANSAVIHKNRVVCAVQGISEYVSLSAFTPPTFSRVDSRANTIMWSAITGESGTAANTKSDGMLAMLYAGWPKSQYLTLDTAGITGLVSLDANNLMVLCVDKILMISGTLGAVLPNAKVDELSVNIRTLSTNIGCAYPKTIQKTPKGVIFSDLNTVYITDGADFVNLMQNKIQLSYGYFSDSVGTYGADFPTGSAVLLNNHYLLFTKYGLGFMCDLDNDFSWSRFKAYKSVSPYFTTFGSGINDPSGSGRVYAPSFQVDPANPDAASGSRICRMDTMVFPDAALASPTPAGYTNLCDPDTTFRVNCRFITKSYTFGSSAMKRFQKVVFTGNNTAPNTLVALKSGLDPDPMANNGSFYLGLVYYNTQPSVRKDIRGTTPPGGFTNRITNVGLALEFGTAFNSSTPGQAFWLDKLSFNYVPARQGRTQR